MSSDKRADRLAQVESQVDYHRERLALYRRLHGSLPSTRLQELEHAYLGAQDRLARCAAGRGTTDRVAGNDAPPG